MGENVNTFKILLVVGLALAGLGVFLASRDKLRNGFLLFIVLLSLGYRTLPITPRLRILPAELVLYALAVLVVGRSPPPGETPTGRRLPLWLVGMMPFWILAWTTGSEGGFAWDDRLSECRNFALLVPLYLVLPVVLARAGAWRSIVLTMLGVSVVLAATGLLEHVFPSVPSMLPGMFVSTERVLADGFERASFSFYGSALAAFVCVIMLPLSLAVWEWWPNRRERCLTGVAVALQLGGIYISGWRSMWLVVGLQLAVLLVVRRHYLVGVAAVGLVLAAYGFLPEGARGRIDSLVAVLEGRPVETDTSGQHRWRRATEALNWALEEPAGHGWAATGWVHSDFIQVAANQGVVPAVIFLSGYLVALARMVRRIGVRGLPPDLQALQLPLLLSFLAVGAVLLFDGVEYLTQCILPVWLVWGLIEVWLVQAAAARRPARTAARRFSRISQTPALIKGV